MKIFFFKKPSYWHNRLLWAIWTPGYRNAQNTYAWAYPFNFDDSGRTVRADVFDYGNFTTPNV